MKTDLSIADSALLGRIELDTETIEWKDLVHFFARGNVIFVSERLDLIDTALQISKDNASGLNVLMQRGWVEPISDVRARKWFDDNIVVRASVVTPWVLVQEYFPGTKEKRGFTSNFNGNNDLDNPLMIDK